MKTLSNMKMSEFIDMSCGDLSVLKGKFKRYSDEELISHARHIMFDYKSIVNPSSARAAIALHYDNSERRARMLLLRVCLTMISIGGLKDVCEILRPMYDTSDGDKLKKRIASDLRTLEFEQKRYEAKHPKDKDGYKTPEEIRNMFDEGQAAVMSILKMGIDVNNVTASVYAHMTKQAMDIVKAKAEALRK